MSEPLKKEDMIRGVIVNADEYKSDDTISPVKIDAVWVNLENLESAVEWFKDREWTLCPGKCTKCGEWHTYREHRIKEDIEQDEFICFRCCLDESFPDLNTQNQNKENKED